MASSGKCRGPRLKGAGIILERRIPLLLAAMAWLAVGSTAGDFSIDEPVMAEAFWGYFTDEKRHDFMAPDSEDAARAFRTPPWEDS